MRKKKIIEQLAFELNIKKLSDSDIENLCNMLTEKFNQNKENLLRDFQCRCIRRGLDWNIFKLPIDCVYIYNTIEKVSYREEGDKLFSFETDDKITIRYISSNNSVWTKIRMEIKDYMKQNFLLKTEEGI